MKNHPSKNRACIIQMRNRNQAQVIMLLNKRTAVKHILTKIKKICVIQYQDFSIIKFFMLAH
jgi:ribonuclease D